jgi:hypothetical protein
MIFVLRPPDIAGPPRIGTTGPEAVDTLKLLGIPTLWCTGSSRHAWGVFRRPGLSIGAFFDAQHRCRCP